MLTWPTARGLPGFIAVLDGPEHRYEFVNATYSRLFGERDYVGKSVGELFPELEGQGIFELLNRVYETGERYIAEALPVRLNVQDGAAGNERYLDFIYAPVTDEDGRVTGIFCEGHDVTEIHRAQEELRELNDSLERRVVERTAELEQAQEALRQSQKLEAMGQLTGGVAHDFNNLLTPIIGSLDMLQRQKVGNERTQRLIEGALQSADRAKTLVQRLLAFARRQPLQPVAVDVAGLVAGMAELVESTSGPRVKVEVVVESDLPAARADANQVEMAILNLAVNARDAMPDGGKLSIAASSQLIERGHKSKLPPGQYIRLAVSDTGVGMDRPTLDRAIEPFFSTKGIGQGTGLGLSMVHGLASQLGGALTISSRPGVGTCVELWLPVAGEEAALSEESREPEATAGAGEVLLVDDEALVRASTAHMLSELGFTVTEAGSAEEAVGILTGGFRPDLLVTDHLMPGKSGTDLVREAQDDLAGNAGPHRFRICRRSRNCFGRSPPGEAVPPFRSCRERHLGNELTFTSARARRCSRESPTRTAAAADSPQRCRFSRLQIAEKAVELASTEVVGLTFIPELCDCLGDDAPEDVPGCARVAIDDFIVVLFDEPGPNLAGSPIERLIAPS